MLSVVRTLVSGALIIGVFSQNLVWGQGQKLESLLKRTPAPANAAAYLHAPSLRKLMSDAEMPEQLNENVEEAWLVAELDTVSLTPAWEAGYAKINKSVNADSLAAAVSGYVDVVGETKAVWTPRQSYLLPMSEGSLGFLRPARRSLLAKWINSSPDEQVPSAYLTSQAKQNEAYLSFMLAVDLENTISEANLLKRISTFEFLKDQNAEPIAKILASVRGLSIIVGRRSLNECILSVEFSQSPASLAPIANDLLVEILNRNGTQAPETKDWKVAVDGNKLSFKGAITADSLDGVMGIFSINGHADQLTEQLAVTAASGSNGVVSDSQVATASKAYFDKTNAFIERVRKYKAQNTGYRAKWDEQQARKIDELGTLNVDPLMVDYGANVANILRNNGSSIRDVNVAAGQTKAEESRSGGYVNNYYGGYYGGYGGYTSYRTPKSIALDQNTTAAQSQMAGFGSYQEALAAIDKLTGDTRRSMTEKYQVQF